MVTQINGSVCLSDRYGLKMYLLENSLPGCVRENHGHGRQGSGSFPCFLTYWTVSAPNLTSGAERNPEKTAND